MIEGLNFTNLSMLTKFVKFKYLEKNQLYDITQHAHDSIVVAAQLTSEEPFFAHARVNYVEPKCFNLTCRVVLEGIMYAKVSELHM